MNTSQWHLVRIFYDEGEPGHDEDLTAECVSYCNCCDDDPIRDPWYCPVEHELYETGVEDVFDKQRDGTGLVIPGRYLVQVWWDVYPSGPWGPEEYNGGWEVERIPTGPNLPDRT